MKKKVVNQILSRAIPQAISLWLPTAAARFRARVWSCGIFGGQSDAGADFFRVLRFSLPNFIPPIAPQSPSIIWGWYNRPVVAAVPSGLSLTPLRILIIIKIIRLSVFQQQHQNGKLLSMNGIWMHPLLSLPFMLQVLAVEGYWSPFQPTSYRITPCRLYPTSSDCYVGETHDARRDIGGN
jgi:hypothetical protein